MPKIFCIDPGHGGADPGAVNGSRHEADDNVRLSLAVSNLLTGQGHKVVLTHKGDIPSNTKLALEARSKIAVDCKADLFSSLHRNSYIDNSAVGVEIWTRYNASIQAASAVYEAVSASCGMKSRGMKVGNYLVLYNLPMPGMLLEQGFISNAGDNMLFDQRLSQNAEAIAKGMLAALGEPWNNTPLNPYWRVQVGAFGVQGNAEAFLVKVKADGFPAFLVYYEEKEMWRVQVGAFSVAANAQNYLKQVKAAGYEAFLVTPDTGVS